MSITKKPYEISLWDEQLVWHRRKLDPVNNSEEFTSANPYRRGAYYVESGAQGATTYELSYEEYDSDREYYKLAPLSEDNYIESYDSTGLNINQSTHSSWYLNGKMIPNVIFSFYKEVRLCTIGSDTMDSPARAVNGKLVTKVNGEVTFTFTVYYRYFDNMTGQLEYNPFMPYLANERKVKLKYDGEWYDLIIKQIQENSDTKAFTYTCKSQFINELSKTGFELEFDNELENNMGTVDYLADQILEGSDWKREGNSNLKQFVEEPLYRITLGSNIKANHMEDQTERTILAGRKIYAFYSQVVDQKKELQFVYIDSSSFDINGDSTFTTNDDLVIDKELYPNYVVSVESYDDNGWPNFTAYSTEGEKPALAQISTKYRGMRLVRQARTIYDSKIDKFVKVYKKQGDANTIYYGFEETKYLSPNAVNNYIVNPNAFTSTTGWYVQPNAGVRTTLELVTDPPFNATNAVSTTNFTSYLKFPNNGGALVNSSINSFKSSLEGFVKDETKYVLRLKCKKEVSDKTYIEPTALKIYQYQDMDGFEVIGDHIFKFNKILSALTTNEEKQDTGFIYYEATCETSVTKDALKNWENHYGLFLTFGDTYKNVYIEDIQLFPKIEYKKDEKTLLCVPGGELFSKIETVQKYYDSSQVYTSIEEIEFEPAGGTYTLQYEEGATAFTKISSIAAKESNRFNLLQDLNEKFECWSKFRVDRNKTTGEIKYGKDVGKLTGDEAYRQQKFVVINEYAGAVDEEGKSIRNYAGFKYGINSKSIQRTIDSNAITTKMIVKDNANEFAPNGFCSIARADDNTAKENFLLNFDHYYRQKLLDLDVVTNDLCMDANGYLGYYKKLREINRDRDGLIEQQANLLKDIANYEASYQTYKTSYDSAIEERNQMESNIFLLIVPTDKREEASAKSFQDVIREYSANWTTNSNYIKYTTSWTQCCSVINQHGPLYIKADEHLNGRKDSEGNVIEKGVKQQYDDIAETLKEKAEQKRALNLQFYKKYSRFIQEGSWIKEDYIDDNLYYLDSMSTLQTSAQPKVTYNISVIDVSPLPGYEVYEFKLGDITYIEDREFFGYSLIDGTTPYREEIVVSEITVELDTPEKNSIKVQNYKTQFEDLFQRITAQTQQAEYHTGEYKRVASVVETDGSISVSTLENSFANNSFKLSNARDQSVVINEFGITSTSLANPSEMVRIVNGGIFMSTDGGQSWKTGLTGYGLNSSYMTAGQINTDEIYIMSGSQPAFGWDEKGISAYALSGGSYDLNKCVRFDRHGIYGVISDEKYNSTEQVMQSAPFALTWKGFSLKNDNGSVSITSADDIKVSEGNNERIKIGRLGTYLDEGTAEEGTQTDPVTKTLYGLRISNNNGPVMETDSDGNLWLKGSLTILTQGDSLVQIGALNNDLVINAANNFTVDKNGRVVANNTDISGRITATSGWIGGLEIASDLTAQNKTTSLTVPFDHNFSINFAQNDGNIRSALQITKDGMIIHGIIDAQEGGNIGGFIIRDNKLQSQNYLKTSDDQKEEGKNYYERSEDGQYVLTQDDQFEGNKIYYEFSPNVVLDGAGNIVANSIELGVGAIISDSISLGSAKIQNPVNPDNNTDNNRPFITAGNEKLEIYQNGLIKAGDITIDGPNSEIYGINFSITPEAAHFDNVRVRGEIETTVFKVGSTQAAGGAMIFRPSYKIKSKENWSEKAEFWFELEDDYQGMVGNEVWVFSNDAFGDYRIGTIIEQQSEAKKIVIQFNSINQTDYDKFLGIVDVGYHGYLQTMDDSPRAGKSYYCLEEEQYTLQVFDENEGFDPSKVYHEYRSELLMGVNSGEVAVGDGSILPRGFTITEYNPTKSKKIPNLFLGDLRSLKTVSGENYTGYGLYADNVYLNGSLTTKSNTGSYAGVNTLSGVAGDKNIVGTDSNIIFWAGAEDTSDSAIQKANFQVTEDGHVYLANSLIAGSEIRAAKIRGWNKETGEAALSIYDAETGISFRKDGISGDIELFAIGVDGLKVGGNYFIKIEDDQALLKTRGDTNYVALQEVQGVPALYHYHSDAKSCGLYFDENKTSFKFNIANTETTAAIFSGDLVTFKQNVELSSGAQKMQYKSVNDGYNLYIV